jgi:hypothetical protein
MKKNIFRVAPVFLFFMVSFSDAFAAVYPPDVQYTAVPVQNIPRPALLTPITTEYGTQMMRITDNYSPYPNNYSKNQPWNSDQTLLKFVGGKLYDAKTYQYIRTLPSTVRQSGLP